MPLAAPAGTAPAPVEAEPKASPVSPWNGSRAKRGLDLGGALVLLVGSLPVMLAVSALVLLTSGAPLLYSQVRLGQGLRPFTVYKIRTMRRDAEANTGPVLAIEGDPRVTAVGRRIRSTRLDEVPQLWNVIRGEMSLVGPRPERPGFVSQFMREIPGYAGRFAIKPGITGPAQVAESYHATARQKLVHDLDYCRRASLGYDLRVLWQTIAVVLRAGGR